MAASVSNLRVLGPRESALLIAERALLGELRESLASLDADPEHLAAVRQAAADLDDLFLLVVVGEFNAGKSALLNALLGGPYVEEGVTPTTAEVTIIRYGDPPGERALGNGSVERTLPAPLLREISIVDTPGTNAIIRRHEELTREFVPRSDLVLFVTSVDRPFAESERAFMEHIRDWGKKVIIILNKVDLLQDERQLDQVRAFVGENVDRLLGFTPEIFPLSTRMALQAKTAAHDAASRQELWERSGFEALERYLSETLDEAERVRLKLLNPLGVAERITAKEVVRTRERLEVLGGDLKGAEAIESQLDLYRGDLRRDFTRRLQDIDNVVHDLNDRADAFFDETLRLGRVFDLFNADRLRTEFERKVIADSARRIDDTVQSLVDWILDQEQRIWRSVADFVSRRTGAAGGTPSADALPTEGWSFAQERRRMLASVERAADHAMKQYDPDSEAKRWSLSMREAVTQTALTEVGALGLGAAVVALIGSTALDITGLLAASVVAGLGFYIIPLRRRQARDQFRQKTEALRTRLKDGLSRQFEAELERSAQRVGDVLAPYSRRVRAEYDRLERTGERLHSLQRQVADLRARAERELPSVRT